MATAFRARIYAAQASRNGRRLQLDHEMKDMHEHGCLRALQIGIAWGAAYSLFQALRRVEPKEIPSGGLAGPSVRYQNVVFLSPMESGA